MDTTLTQMIPLDLIGDLDLMSIYPENLGINLQIVTSAEDRRAMGMYYTSVPNILKVLNPLFLDELRDELKRAGDDSCELETLRSRLGRIRVFDPACGSGNFLVIAYKELRTIEAEINRRRGEPSCKSLITLTNFRGIEINDFPAGLARLALIITEYQCDVLHCGLQPALENVLPPDSETRITSANALRVDWLSVFPAEGGETYICGNPPFRGSTGQTREQKADMKAVFDGRCQKWRSLNYVTGWFMKAADYGKLTSAVTAFISTDSICQGQQVPILWPLIFSTGTEIAFAYTGFKWTTPSCKTAATRVIIISLSHNAPLLRRLFSISKEGAVVLRQVENINAYLLPATNVFVEGRQSPLSRIGVMRNGNKPEGALALLLTEAEVNALDISAAQQARFIRRIYGGYEFINDVKRYYLWIKDQDLEEVQAIPCIADRIEAVRAVRLKSKKKDTRALAATAHQLKSMDQIVNHAIVVPLICNDLHSNLPCGLLNSTEIITDLLFALYDAPLWNLALVASRLHLVWIDAVCCKKDTSYSYSNTIGWNTFPVPLLTEKMKADLTRSAEDILLAREVHFPATIADLYHPKNMPGNLRRAHEKNDETLERIYIGRRFKNNTERLETLFKMYSIITGGVSS